MKNVINGSVTFSYLIEVFKITKSRYYYVISLENRLIGVISQSDILLCLLDGRYSRISSVLEIMNPNYIFWNKEKINTPPLELLKKEKLSECPIINNQGNLIGIFSIYEHENN